MSRKKVVLCYQPSAFRDPIAPVFRTSVFVHESDALSPILAVYPEAQATLWVAVHRYARARKLRPEVYNAATGSVKLFDAAGNLRDWKVFWLEEEK